MNEFEKLVLDHLLQIETDIDKVKQTLNDMKDKDPEQLCAPMKIAKRRAELERVLEDAKLAQVFGSREK